MKKQNEVEEDGKENGVFWQQLLDSVENWYRRRAALHTWPSLSLVSSFRFVILFLKEETVLTTNLNEIFK